MALLLVMAAVPLVTTKPQKCWWTSLDVFLRVHWFSVASMFFKLARCARSFWASGFAVEGAVEAGAELALAASRRAWASAICSRSCWRRDCHRGCKIDVSIHEAFTANRANLKIGQMLLCIAELYAEGLALMLQVRILVAE